MRFLMFVLVILLCSTRVLGQEIEPVVFPTEVMAEIKAVASNEELIKDKVWNRWTTKNFVVCSLSNSQAQYLHANLENIKTWLQQRWGLYDVDFSAECKLICVDDENLFKKLFRLEKSSVEVRRDSNGKIKETVLFLLLNEPASRTIPMALTEACISEFEQKVGTKFGWWAHRGMAVLNGTSSNIRQCMQGPSAYFSIESIFNMTEEQYRRCDPEARKAFDRISMIMCLFLKKEFGTTKFQEMLKETSSGQGIEPAIVKVLMFKNLKDFDLSFQRYVKDLSDDIVANVTPDRYLSVEAR